MAKTARAAIEDLLTCESCHAFYYVERAEDGARTRLRCTSCGHSRDVLLSGAKTNKWTVIDPNGEVKTFTEWDELVRSMAGSVVTAVRAKLPSDRPAISERAMSEAPPAAAAKEPSVRPGSNRPPSNRPGSNRPMASPAAVEIPPMHEVQPIGPSVVAAAPQEREEVEEERKSLSGAALLDVTPTPIQPKLALSDSSPGLPPAESDKSIDVALSEPALPVSPESKPEGLVEALVSSMPEASAPPAPAVEQTRATDVAPVEAKPQEPWDDDEAEVLSMKDIQVVPVAERTSEPAIVMMPDARDSQRNSSTPPPPARGALKTLPPARPDALPPPTITFEDGKKSDPPPATAKKSDSIPGPAKVPAEAKAAAKSDPPKKKDAEKARDKDTEKDARGAATIPPKRGASAKPAAATAKAQVAAPEEGGRSWLLPAIGVAAAAGVVWWLANGNTPPQAQTNSPTAPTTTAAPANTAATTAMKPSEPSTTTTTTTATATGATTTTAPTEKAATTNVKPADPPPTATAKPAEPTNNGAATEPKKPSNANLSMSEALDKAGQAKRSGDYAAAKDLYARVLRESASNVEAHSGLGDIAKAQGDLAGAKASYQKALSSSPDYAPALLNLADTEWDMGDRAAAQQHYARIVAARGGSAPERAKQRAGGENN